jgi:hypothetical protein
LTWEHLSCFTITQTCQTFMSAASTILAQQHDDVFRNRTISCLTDIL